MIDPLRLQLLHRDDVIDRRTLDAMLESMEPGLARQLRLVILLFVGAIAALLAFAALVWALSDAQGRAGVVKTMTHNPGLFLPILVSVLIVPLAAARRKHGARLPAVLLRFRRCPHCGYDLTGLPRQAADGATVCPECACAWDLEGVPPVGTAPTSAPPAVAVKIGIVGALVFGFIVITSVLLGRGGGTMQWESIALVVAGVLVVTALAVGTFLMWRRLGRP